MQYLFRVLMLLGTLSPLFAEPWKEVPLPVFKEPLTLRVVYAHNPRFQPLSPGTLHTMLNEARETARKQLGVRINFQVAPQITVKELFGYLTPAVKAARADEIYDFKSQQGDFQRLKKAMLRGLNERRTPLDSMIAYATPYLSDELSDNSLPAFADILARTLLARIGDWQGLKARDGKPVIGSSPYNEWTYWDALGYGALPYDIVITNSLIASVEYYGQDIHSALRGGLTVGTTTNNRSPLGAFVFWSTFPFMEEAPLLTRLRDADYRVSEGAKLSGTYLVHEIGHLLFHYGHTFETDSCIMTPVPMLHFKSWAKKLDPKKCRSGYYPAMQKGAATIYYNPEWCANPGTAAP